MSTERHLIHFVIWARLLRAIATWSGANNRSMNVESWYNDLDTGLTGLVGYLGSGGVGENVKIIAMASSA